MIRRSDVDAAIDAEDDEHSIAVALADLLDREGAWDWTDDAEHDPSDRLAVVESSHAWWVVYRGTEADEANRYGDHDRARAEMRRKAEQCVGPRTRARRRKPARCAY